MLKKQLLIVVCFLSVTVSGWAQVELNPSHPDTYVVQKGDTLWDISEMFLQSPWLWPEIWYANPQIENPHLIYPGDTLSLVYLDGQPRVTVTRGHPTVKLSPEIRELAHDEAITTIPLGDIEPFLRKLRILSEEEIQQAAYVVSAEEQRSTPTPPYHIYVRGMGPAQQGEKYAVVRPTVIYRDVPAGYPWQSEKGYKTESVKWNKSRFHSADPVLTRFWKDYLYSAHWDKVVVLGYEVADTATAEVVRVGDQGINTLQLKTAREEVMKGDLILPLDEFKFDPYFSPRAGESQDENIRVVALNQALYGSGKRQIVAVSRGAEDGLQIGDVYAVYRPEQVVRDEVMYPKDTWKTLFKPSEAEVTLPEEYVGNIMIFKTFDRISYAIITDGNRPVQIFDYVRQP